MRRKDNDGKQDVTAKPSTAPRMSFSSEDLLQQAIAGLLTRMPDNTDVQILQGTMELGKDIIFYKQGRLRRARPLRLRGQEHEDNRRRE